jgi:hypothetical protein
MLLRPSFSKLISSFPSSNNPVNNAFLSLRVSQTRSSMLFSVNRWRMVKKTRPGRYPEQELIALRTLMINQVREVFC